MFISKLSTFALVAVQSLGTVTACAGGGHAGRGPDAPTSAPEIHQGRADRQDDKNGKNNKWEKLGERVVEGKVDHDAIVVGREDGRFSTIEIRVDGSTLEMRNIVVTFGDGSTFSPETRAVFDKGSTSRAIDLPGDRRVIKRVAFTYGNLPGGGRARVELYAR